MAEQLVISGGSRSAQYESLLPQAAALLGTEPDLIARLANAAAVLKVQFQWYWVGFYIVKDEELVLGPFQGPPACVRIRKGKGVCGSAWERKETIIVPDVSQFPGHIACSAISKSEIVTPLFRPGTRDIVAVLDADSEQYACFDDIDQQYLENLAAIIMNGNG